MKRILFCVLCLSPLFGGPVLYAQQDSSASAPAQSKAAASPVAPRIDPDKEAAIRRFMQLTGSESIGPEIANQIQVLLRPTLEASLPPGEYRAKLIDLFLEKFGTRATTEIIMPMVVSWPQNGSCWFSGVRLSVLLATQVSRRRRSSWARAGAM